MASNNTTAFSDRNINIQFDAAEFNKNFEEKDKELDLINKKNVVEKKQTCPDNTSINLYQFIIFCIIMVGILLLLLNKIIS